MADQPKPNTPIVQVKPASPIQDNYYANLYVLSNAKAMAIAAAVSPTPLDASISFTAVQYYGFTLNGNISVYTGAKADTFQATLIMTADQSDATASLMLNGKAIADLTSFALNPNDTLQIMISSSKAEQVVVQSLKLLISKKIIITVQTN